VSREKTMFERIDHVGIAISDKDSALSLWRDTFGLPLEKIEEIEEQKLTSYHLPIGSSRIELLVPTDPTSAIATYLAKRGTGIHHIAFAIEDLDSARRQLIEDGLEPVGPPSIGANGKRIQFFHPRTTGGVLLEICSMPTG